MSRCFSSTVYACLLLSAGALCFLPAALLADELDGPSPYWLDARRSCGPFCLSFLDKVYGGKRDYREIAEACPPGPEGTTLAQVRQAVEQLGYHSAPFEGTVAQLTRLRYPAILHYQYAKPATDNQPSTTNHFVVLLEWNETAGTFKIFNPPGSLDAVSYDNMANHFSGVGLIISNTPLPPLKDVLSPPSLWPMLTTVWSSGLLLLVLILKFWRPQHGRKAVFTGAAIREATTVLPLLVTGLLVGCDSSRPDASVEATSPRANSGTYFNAGEVLEGTLIKHSFRIVNTGDSPLHFKELKGQ